MIIHMKNSRVGRYLTRRMWLAVALVALLGVVLLIVIVSVAVYVVGARNTGRQLEVGQSYWIYVNKKEQQAYLFNPQTGKNIKYLKLSDGERIRVSPDGKKITRTRGNVVETATTAKTPDFVQIYADSDPSMELDASWLPDGSGMLVHAHKVTDPGDIPKNLSVITRIKADGSSPQKLIQYPIVWGSLVIDSVDMSRDELYVGETSEGGGRIATNVFRLSNGELLQKVKGSSTFPVVNGAGYSVTSIADPATGREKAQLQSTDIHTLVAKVVYEAPLDMPGLATDGVAVRSGLGTLVLSSDQHTIYFNEIHIANNNTNSVLKAFDARNGRVRTVYTTRQQRYIMIDTQTGSENGSVHLVWCGDCVATTHNKQGFKYIYIDKNGTTKTIQTVDYGPILQSFQPIILTQ